MTTFDKFLKEQGEALPPTEKEREWATENFSSSVDPPQDQVCLTAPAIEDAGFDMHVLGLEVHCLFIGHNLVDVPFDDDEGD